MVDHKSTLSIQCHEKDHTSSWQHVQENKSNATANTTSSITNRKRQQRFVCVPPELLEASIIDDAKYHSELYLKNQDIFASNKENKKAANKKYFMSKWICKVEYHRSKSLQPQQSELTLSQPLSSEDLYHEKYPKNLKLHKIKILCFLDPNTYNKDSKHRMRLPAAYRGKYTRDSEQKHNERVHCNDTRFGDVHITYLPAAIRRRDRHHTSLDYNGYHYSYKLYDYVSLRKYNGVQHVAETRYYKQKIARFNKHKHQYVMKKEVLDLKANEHDKYAAFLLAFVWNLFSMFEECCETDGQFRKSIKFKICKKMSNVLNQHHFHGYRQGQANGHQSAMIMHRKRMMNQHHKKQNNLQLQSDTNVERKSDDQHSDSSNGTYSVSPSPSSRLGDNNQRQYYRGPLKMEMW